MGAPKSFQRGGVAQLPCILLCLKGPPSTCTPLAACLPLPPLWKTFTTLLLYLCVQTLNFFLYLVQRHPNLSSQPPPTAPHTEAPLKPGCSDTSGSFLNPNLLAALPPPAEPSSLFPTQPSSEVLSVPSHLAPPLPSVPWVWPSCHSVLARSFRRILDGFTLSPLYHHLRQSKFFLSLFLCIQSGALCTVNSQHIAQ